MNINTADYPVSAKRDLGISVPRAVLLLGIFSMLLPTMFAAAGKSWTSETGMHGPIVLATGIWLILRDRAAIVALARPGSATLATIAFVVAALIYVFARGLDFLSVEVGAMIMAFVAVAYGLFGGRVIRRMWFPIIYLCFLIPLPGWALDLVTAPLKRFVSWSSVNILAEAGYPIARQGVTIFIDQYQLLVEDACAGLNSLTSLTAISLFYIYLRYNSSWRYALFLMLWIVPVAILANMVRIVLLVLLTYYAGNETAQGFLHATTGLILFMAALLGIFLVDSLATPLRHILSRRSA